MHVAELGRFPVKSMAGEPLGRANVRPDGIVGDRVAYVLGAHGRIVTARRRPRLLGHRATLGMDGEPQVDGVRGHSSTVSAGSFTSRSSSVIAIPSKSRSGRRTGISGTGSA